MQRITDDYGRIGCCELLTICIFEILNAADKTKTANYFSCELLTICIFEILNAACLLSWIRERRLWIAYNLYLWNIECSRFLSRPPPAAVVNCLQFVSLKYWMQHSASYQKVTIGCELLTICIFEILNAAYVTERYVVSVLWIAYNLYLWNIECSFVIVTVSESFVVNCLQFVSLKYWMQLKDPKALT